MDKLENILNDTNLIEEEKIKLRKLINNFKYEDIYINQIDYDALIDYQRSYPEKLRIKIIFKKSI